MTGSISLLVVGGEHLAPWEFSWEEGALTVMPKPRFIVNDMGSLLAYCEAGLSLTYTYSKAVETLVKEQPLTRVLEPFVPALPRFSINFVTKRHMPARLRAFIDLAKAWKE